MEWTTKAISYVRFSSKKQERGDSVRRQDSGTLTLCERHGLILDTTFSFRDLAKSGYTGANLLEGSDLANFLDQMRIGKIPRGVTLIVEKLDRVSRQHPMKVLHIIDEILKSGIRIATTSPDRFYTDDDLKANPYILYELLSILMSGYEESAKKSMRCGEAWQEKRKAAVATGKVFSKQCPTWLEVKPDRSGFNVIPERVKTMKRIFKLADTDGIGAPAIAKLLNAEGIPGFKAKQWLFTFITKLLKDRRVLGEHQPHSDKAKKIPIGEPIKGYYPTVIDIDLFNRVQVARQVRRKNKQGREEKGITNVFRGMLLDANSGTGIGLFTYTDRRRGQVKKAARLIVRNDLDRGTGYDLSFRYEVFESAFFRFIDELDPADFADSKSADAQRLSSLSASLMLIGEKIDLTKARMKSATDAKKFAIYQDTLVDLESEKGQVRDDYDRLRMRLSSPIIESVGDAKSLIGMIASSADPNGTREKIRSRLRQIIGTAYLMTWDEGIDSRHALCQVNFPDGSRRFFLTGYSLSRKGFKGIEFGTDRLESFPYDLATFPTLTRNDAKEEVNEAIGWLKQMTFN